MRYRPPCCAVQSQGIEEPSYEKVMEHLEGTTIWGQAAAELRAAQTWAAAHVAERGSRETWSEEEIAALRRAAWHPAFVAGRWGEQPGQGLAGRWVVWQAIVWQQAIVECCHPRPACLLTDPLPSVCLSPCCRQKAKLAPRGERMISWQPIADEVSKVGKGRTNVQCQVLETVPWLWRLCRLPRSCLFPVPSCHLCPKTAYLRLPPLPSACRHLRRLPVACCAAGKVEAPHRTRGASGEAAQALQAACLVV